MLFWLLVVRLWCLKPTTKVKKTFWSFLSLPKSGSTGRGWGDVSRRRICSRFCVVTIMCDTYTPFWRWTWTMAASANLKLPITFVWRENILDLNVDLQSRRINDTVQTNPVSSLLLQSSNFVCYGKPTEILRNKAAGNDWGSLLFYR